MLLLSINITKVLTEGQIDNVLFAAINVILKTEVYDTFYSVFQLLLLQSEQASNNSVENNVRIILVQKRDMGQQCPAATNTNNHSRK